MKNSKYIGTGVAMVTPFKNGELEYKSIGGIVDHLIEGGIEYIVPLGSTGESAFLNESESRKILDVVIDCVNGRIPIVAGNFGGKNTAQICEKLETYNFKGIDAVLSSSPEYVKPTQEGLFQHYMALENSSPLPIILYNVPGRTRSNMEWETTVRLANASKKFIAIKEASGDLIQASKIVQNRPDHFLLISGDDETAMPLVACGGEGVISVIGNAFPRLFSDMIRAALSGNFTDARALNFKTYDIHKWLYIEGNPVGIKGAMQIKGLCESDVRLPLCKLSEGNYKELEKAMKNIIHQS